MGDVVDEKDDQDVGEEVGRELLQAGEVDI